MDLVIASCACPYHPVCAAVLTLLFDNCAKYEEQFLENWLNNFGLLKCKGMSMSHIYLNSGNARSVEVFDYKFSADLMHSNYVTYKQ